MHYELLSSKIRNLFLGIFKHLTNFEGNSPEKWYEISEFSSFFGLENKEINELLINFDCFKRKQGNYTKYIAIDKVEFVLEAIQFLDVEFRTLAEILNFSEFELLVCKILEKNHFYTTKNFRFSDQSDLKSKTKQKRYEIDVIGLKRSYLVVIDAKQWNRRDVFSSMNKAANHQYQRVVALKRNSDVVSKLIHDLLGNKLNIKQSLPFIVLPIMVTLEDNGIRLNDNQIPLVGINKFNSFLQEFELYLDYYKTIQIKKISIQKPLF